MSDHNEIERRPLNGPQPTEEVVDVEVIPKAQRRRFSAAYKRRILQEMEACTQPGEIGALLRREGLYSSLLSTWRRQSERGELDGLSEKKRGRKADPQAAEIARLRLENERLQARLERAESVIEIHTCPPVQPSTERTGSVYTLDCVAYGAREKSYRGCSGCRRPRTRAPNDDDAVCRKAGSRSRCRAGL